MRRLLCGMLALMLLAAVCPCALAETDFSAAFPDKFLAEGEEPVVTETSYRSHNIAIEITTQRFIQSDVYVADVYVRTLDYFVRHYAQNDWHKATDKMPVLAAESNAILALTGDSSQNFRSGWVMGNGQIERDGIVEMNTVRDICVVYKSGEVRVVPSPTKEDNEQIGEEAGDIWHIFLFGPSLLDEEGKALGKNYPTLANSNVKSANPRSVFGYYEPGHYCFVQVDGRLTSSKLEKAKNKGLTLGELAELMESLGCKAAYNLDGGRSSMMWFGDQLISTPAAKNRQIGDVLVITEGE
ncbi:MAG: phosphodiester glycosidase family protein [Christensenellaceae bacterium]|nr:phosphodiester glycosidase family protein [Christensenellaceae bacterium]